MSQNNSKASSEIVKYDRALFVRGYDDANPYVTLSRINLYFNQVAEECVKLFNAIAKDRDYLEGLGYKDIHYDIISAKDVDPLEARIRHMVSENHFEL